MFGIEKIKQLEKQVEELENKIFGEKLCSIFGRYSAERFGGVIEENKNLKEELTYLSKRFNTLLKHLKIEYHEITDKNGSTKVTEVYKKAKKVKPKKERYYDEDDDD